MGITIHYTLITDDLETVMASIKITKELAMKNGYDVEEVDRDVGVCYSPFSMRMDWRNPEGTKEYLKECWKGYREEVLEVVPDEPPWPWIAIDYPEKGWYTYATPWILYDNKSRPSRLQGVVVTIDTAEPFYMCYYTIGKYYICNNFTKTQAFVTNEVEPNTLYHKWICHLLKYLERNGRWWNFYVADESEYYYTLDESKITESFQKVNSILYTLASIIDEVAEKLGGEVSIGGGNVDIRKMRKNIEEVYREDYEVDEKPRRPYQSTLDEFINRRVDEGYG